MSRAGIDEAIPRRAMVTGAARRLGRVLALALAEDGFDIALHVREVDTDGLRLAQQIQALGRQAVLVPADLADPVARRSIMTRATEQLGPIGVLVNSAATFPDDRLADLTADVLQATLEVNLVAPCLLSQAFAGQLSGAAQGVIVNLVDQRVLKPTPRRLSYTLAKSALWTATRLMARELAPRIRVVAIGPGIAIPDPDMDEASFQRISQRTPLGRTGSGDEIVCALRYLLAARSVTGQMLTVDGGMHLG